MQNIEQRFSGSDAARGVAIGTAEGSAAPEKPAIALPPPLAVLAGTGRKATSRAISREPIQASRPRCKVHGAAAVIGQVALA